MSKKDFQIDKFNTDKIAYIPYYDKYLSSLKKLNINILELGILNGGSLLMWEKYFKSGSVVGIDIDKIKLDKKSSRITIYKGDQKDITLLEKVTKKHAKNGFDIIIDDASHFGHETWVSFVYLFKNSLKAGGVYVIEDWNTGYWPHYPDGRNIELDKHHLSYHLHNKTNYKFKKKGLVNRGPYLNNRRFRSHDFGMVGVVKQIIDELAIEGATLPKYTNSENNITASIGEVIFTAGQVFIYKK